MDLPAPPLPALRVGRGELLRLFVNVALVGVGGGLPAHTRRMVRAQDWMTEEEFAEAFTLAQLTPGPNAVNLAAMIGVRLSGKMGALVSVLGILMPGLLLMLAVSVVSVGVALPPMLQSALRGAACAALGVMLTAAIPVVKVGLGVRGGALIAALTFLALGALRLNLLPVLLAMVAIGLIIHFPRKEATRE